MQYPYRTTTTTTITDRRVPTTDVPPACPIYGMWTVWPDKNRQSL